jgi:hypothetical protein
MKPCKKRVRFPEKPLLWTVYHEVCRMVRENETKLLPFTADLRFFCRDRLAWPRQYKAQISREAGTFPATVNGSCAAAADMRSMDGSRSAGEGAVNGNIRTLQPIYVFSAWLRKYKTQISRRRTAREGRRA